jgi:hypothetical protein
MEGLSEHLMLIDAAVAQSKVASIAAVKELLDEIYAGADARVPVKDGLLRDSGQVIEPVEVDGVIEGAVSYGNSSTMTEWNGIGYEVFQEFGTSRNPPTHFLSEATMAVIPGALANMGTAFSAVMLGGPKK